MFINRALWRILGSRRREATGEKKMRNEKFHNLYILSYIFSVPKEKEERPIGEYRSTYEDSVVLKSTLIL